LSYIGSKPANKPVVASDLDPTVITGQTALATSPADTDEFLISDAGVLKRLDASLIGGGKVLQVLQVTKTDTFTSTATSFGDISGLSLAITPSATSSKILINISVPFSCNAARAHFNLVKGSTNIIVGDASSSRIRTTFSGYADSTAGTAYYGMGMFSYSYLDSPSTTSETTYKIQTRVNSGTMFINRSIPDNDNSESGRSASTIILMEIGA